MTKKFVENMGKICYQRLNKKKRRTTMNNKNFQGVRYKNGKTEFCVYAPKTTKVELCFFDKEEKQEIRFEMQKDEDVFWHKSFDGKLEGQKYGYRSHGEYNPNNRNFYNPNKLLVDPYAIELTKTLHNISNQEKEVLFGNNNIDSASITPKSVVRILDKKELEKLYPYLYKKPQTPWRKTHIYELHVGNFTSQHPDIKEENRGKLKALNQTVNYFKSMNYTQIELMPITPTMSDMHLDKSLGLSDQWGYNPINHHAIDPRYGNIYDFLELVNTMHKNGIEVCLDMVYNHTGESEIDRFLLSYKGLAPDEYYRFSQYDGKSFVNTTGCGNGFNPNSEQGKRLIRSSLMFFADVCGVDAFRFDLAGDCALDDSLNFNPNGNFLKIVEEVKAKTGAKMSGEPWSAVGGYFLGQMPQIHEWNDKHEKTLRKFLRGENGQINGLAYYLAGGADNKINIFTKHDGATQYDWATYEVKNNYENNENNNDGSNDNHYSPSYDDEQRLTKTKSAHALNVLARGVPLSLSGDELWHTQNGNNNGYAKSFPLQWQGFNQAQRERYIFARKINAFRQEHPIFSNTENASAEIMPNGKPSWEWVNINGEAMQQNDWDFYGNRFLAYVLNGEDKKGNRFDDDFVVMTSGNVDGEMEVKLPPSPHNKNWKLVFDTSLSCSHKDEREYKKGSRYKIRPQSVVVFTSRRQDDKQNELIKQMLLKKANGM